MSLRKPLLAIAVVASMAAMLPAVAPAQDQPLVEVPTAKNSAVGEINAMAVNVRSGPAESYYPTMQLNKGDRVTVVGHKFDWLKIVPPEGSFSYIAKIYIDRDGAGTSGKVNRDDVLVRAGSSLNQLKMQTQAKLATGAQVQILGEADEFYKIKPPEGAYLYIAKQFVDLVGAAATAPAGEGGAAVSTTKPAEARKAARKTELIEPIEVAPRTETTASADVELEFRKLERQFDQSKDQPLETRPVADLLKGYQAIQDNPQLSSTSRRMTEYRVQYLKAVADQQQELLKAKQSESDFQAKQAALDTEARQIEQRMKEAGVAVYTAVGQLATSSVEKDGQPMMRLVDPADNRTLVYVRLADSKQRALVGQFVGVRGEVATDSTLGIDVIEPTVVETVDKARVLKGVTARIYPPSVMRGPEK